MKLCDIKRNNPYIVNSWRGILHTEKGKRVGTSEEWKDFLTFFNDVSPTYRKGLVLRRLYKDNIIPCCIECDKARSDYFSFEETRKLGGTIREIKSGRLSK